ncbi:MAG: hypothetical protein RLZZ584_1342 [Pseudomonadota bacterium]|jgi:Spx/MgsR family transcriptional regulator
MHTPTLVVHGIPNCDSVRKARTWLEARGIAYTFHDFRKHGLDAITLEAWCRLVDWTVLLNRKGTTWRQLGDAQRASAVDATSACALMFAQPSLIKRPVIAWPDGNLSVGVDLDDYARRAAALQSG